MSKSWSWEFTREHDQVKPNWTLILESCQKSEPEYSPCKTHVSVPESIAFSPGKAEISGLELWLLCIKYHSKNFKTYQRWRYFWVFSSCLRRWPYSNCPEVAKLKYTQCRQKVFQPLDKIWNTFYLSVYL